MIAAISIIKRRPDIDLAAFRKHWLDPHGVLTARLPGTNYYVQSHFVDGPATNHVARQLALDGMPQLWFTDYEARKLAYTSPEIALCNVDSEAFIGAVTRLVTTPCDVIAAPQGTPCAKAVLLAQGRPDRAWSERMRDNAVTADGVIAYRSHDIIEQAAAPNSRIPELPLPIAGLAEFSCRTTSQLAAALERMCKSVDAGRTAIYTAEDVRLV